MAVAAICGSPGGERSANEARAEDKMITHDNCSPSHPCCHLEEGLCRGLNPDVTAVEIPAVAISAPHCRLSIDDPLGEDVTRYLGPKVQSATSDAPGHPIARL
jgi:hypothetical protein